MSDALRLPPRPDLNQYRKLAKDLQTACRSGDPAQMRTWAAGWATTITRLHGREITPDVQHDIDDDTERVLRGWSRLRKQGDERVTRCTLTDAQFLLARAHGFPSWPAFTKHLEALARADSSVSAFEAAADAIVKGDSETLARLLAKHPDLVRARSEREHHSTLLHYVSANGIEDYRQKTPQNIVAITTMLLDAGADINAESGAYGGGSTALGLTATSCHPEFAGVQLAQLDLLLARGASLDSPDGKDIVNACLHNGRGAAAAFMAERGARLDLEAAAGVGRLDVVRGCFNEDGTLRPPATEKQMRDGYAWACEFGHTPVVDFLLSHVPIDQQVRHHGQQGLHWAAYGGHPTTVRLLLDRGADPNAKDATYDGTPLEWCLYQWGGIPEGRAVEPYYEVVAMLARAGGTMDPAWAGDDRERRRAMRRLAADPRMQAALRGET